MHKEPYAVRFHTVSWAVLVKTVPLLLVLLATLWLTTTTESLRSIGWVGALITLIALGCTLRRAHVTCLIVRARTIELRQGMLLRSSSSIPLRSAVIDIHQGVLGRMFDYVDITIAYGGRTIRIANIGAGRHLCRVLRMYRG